MVYSGEESRGEEHSKVGKGNDGWVKKYKEIKECVGMDDKEGSRETESNPEIVWW